ncbi:MAG: PHP domain-containing protein, partial [Dehalococcoidia bacterium]
MEVDLHSHTTVSDGLLEPEELVELAAKRGVRYLAITDHDTTDGLDRARVKAKDFPSLFLIPGIELSTDVPGGEVHLLGFFIEYHDPDLQSTLSRFRQGRKGRARRMVEKLSEMGMPLDWERVRELSGDGAIGRPHVAQALVEKGYVGSIQEAFAKYIGRDGPAYAERDKLTPAEAVRLVTSVNGLPVLAHPGEVPDIETLLRELKEVGLVGMEVYYDNYSCETVQRLAKVARKFHLIPCGGS